MNTLRLEGYQGFVINVGDRVGVVNHGSGVFTRGWFGKVVKINGHGHVTVMNEANGEGRTTEFNKRGEERGRTYGGAILCSAENLQNRLDADKVTRELGARMSLVAELAAKLTAGHRNGYGVYCNPLTAEEKQQLIDAINAV